jgi:hypothetical protein
MERNRLDHAGFVAGTREDLFREERSSAQLTSIVEEFHSATGARAELLYRQSRARAPRQIAGETYTTPFRVSGIPNAAGYDMTIPGSVSHTVAFSNGRFYYQVSATAPPTEGAAPDRAQVILAATSLYDRISAAAPG